MTKREPCPASNSPAHLTLRHDKGKVALSSSAYKYPRRGCREEGGENRTEQRGKYKKKNREREGRFFWEGEEHQGGQNFGGEKENRERGVNELKQEEEDLFEIQRRESGNRRGEGKTETVVSAQRRRRTVPHHLGTTAVLPLHCHHSTVILPPSTLPTPAELKRKKRSRTERGNNERQRRDWREKQRREGKNSRRLHHHPYHSCHRASSPPPQRTTWPQLTALKRQRRKGEDNRKKHRGEGAEKRNRGEKRRKENAAAVTAAFHHRWRPQPCFPAPGKFLPSPCRF